MPGWFAQKPLGFRPRSKVAGKPLASAGVRWNSGTVWGEFHRLPEAEHAEEAAGSVFPVSAEAQTEDKNKDVNTLLEASGFAAVARNAALSPDHLF